MSTVTATPDSAGDIRLTLYGQGGDDVMMITLSPRRAMLLAVDLINLAVRPLFTLGVGEPNSSVDFDRGSPAGSSAGIVENHHAKD
jgi:hypothetical protein